MGVFAAYASPHGYALLDKRLFIPERWFTEPYAHKMKKCQVPEGISFKTKPQLAAAVGLGLSAHRSKDAKAGAWINRRGGWGGSSWVNRW